MSDLQAAIHLARPGPDGPDLVAQRSAWIALANRSRPAAISYAAMIFVLSVATSLWRIEPLLFAFLLFGAIPLALLRGVLAVRFERMYDENPAQARTLFLVGLFGLAAAWGGFSAYITGTYGVGGPTVLVVICTCAVLAAGTASTAIHALGHAGFLLLTGLPYAIASLFHPSSEMVGLAVLAALYLAYLFFEARILRDRFWRSLADRRDLEQANTAKTRFLASVSHELRTPMTAVLGYTQILLQDGPREGQRTHLESIQVAGETLLRVINDLLDVSKSEVARIQLASSPFVVRESIESAIRAVSPRAAQKRLVVSTTIDQDVPHAVIGDGGRVSQILINLVANAVKFTHEGAVDVHLRVASREPLELAFVVSDTGEGVPEDRQAAIFEPFTQAGLHGADARGSGLGLTIAAQLVSLMGGEITLESEVGKGSEFTVRLPFQAVAGSSSRSTFTVPAGGTGLCVLLAEDSPLCAETTMRMLERLGHEVHRARSGTEALSMLTEDRVDFDVAVLDVNMPGMDGVEVVERLRAWEADTGRHLPVLALSADGTSANKRRCLHGGMDAFRTKPILLADLESVVRSVYAVHGAKSHERTPIA